MTDTTATITAHNFSIKQLFKVAWSLSRTQRWIFFFSVLIYSFTAVLISALLHSDLNLSKMLPLLSMQFPELPPWWRKSLPYVAILLIQLPLLAGFWRIAVKAVAQETISLQQLFCCFNFRSIANIIGLVICYFLLFLPLFVGALLLLIHPFTVAHPVLQIIGLAIISLFFIYLIVGYTFGLPLIVLRDLLPHKALKLSRLTINKVWFQVATINLSIALLLTLLSSLSKLTYLGLYVIHMPFLALFAFIGLGFATYYLSAWYWLVFGLLYKTLFSL